jgi:hypothetical protein
VAEQEDPKGKVGYKQPPRHSRFQRGQSGNPKGRPKGSKNFATVLEKELRSKVLITENGKRKRITKAEAIAKQAVNRAANGDPKATTLIFNEARLREAQSGTAAAPHNESAFSAEDKMVMENILRRIRASEPAAEEQRSEVVTQRGADESAASLQEEKKEKEDDEK